MRLILTTAFAVLYVYCNCQIINASVDNLALFLDGTCRADPQNQTAFNFDLTISLENLNDTYSIHLLDGDNRVLGWQLGLSGNKHLENLVLGVVYDDNIAPYRIVLLQPSTLFPLGTEISSGIVDYTSHFFNPHDFDSDCPDIICKGGINAGFLLDKIYDVIPQSQSSPIFINRNLILNGFSLTHNAEFYAGQSVTLNPGYSSGSVGTISSYGIVDCSVQTFLYQCWDLNQNGTKNISEDINNDGVIDDNDCN